MFEFWLVEWLSFMVIFGFADCMEMMKQQKENGNMLYGKKIVSWNLYNGLLGVFGEILYICNF